MNPDPGSFRDRSGRVYRDGDRVLRGLSGAALESWQQLERSGLYAKLREGERIVGTRLVPPSEVPAALAALGWSAILEHDTVPFVSHPWEWPFEMLRDAALLELDVLDEALEKGMVLRDGTAHNVQFLGSQPVFIDVPSIGPYRAGETWAGYRQFCSEFLNPLLLESVRSLPCARPPARRPGRRPAGRLRRGALDARPPPSRGPHARLASREGRFALPRHRGERPVGARDRRLLRRARPERTAGRSGGRSRLSRNPRRESAWEGYETNTSYTEERHPAQGRGRPQGDRRAGRAARLGPRREHGALLEDRGGGGRLCRRDRLRRRLRRAPLRRPSAGR